MENGISNTSPESSTAGSIHSAESAVRNPVVNGLSHVQDLNFRERLLLSEKHALLQERQRILDGNDPEMLNEIQIINEQMSDKKQMLITRMERQFNWVSEQCKLELEKLSAEEKTEGNELTTLMYTYLETLKEGLDNDDKQKIRIEWSDKRSLNALKLADKEISLEKMLPEDEENGCESPMNAVIEKRYTLPGRLTDDTDIKEDLVQLNQSITPTDPDFHEVPRPNRQRHKVLLDRCRLIYDGKTFYRGQKLFVQTTNYTRFPAIVYALADEYVHIRSRTPGDTREVFATIDDLRSGRVRIGRKVLGIEGAEHDLPQSP